MKILFLLCLFSSYMIFNGCGDNSNNKKDESETNSEISNKGTKEIIKKDPTFASEEKVEEYRTTAYNSRLLPDPNSNKELTRIPANIKLQVLDKMTVQQGRMQNNWYKVKYKGKTGWVSGWNMKEGEELVIKSIEEMEKNYEKQIGKKPENDPLTGKIDIIVNWLNKNATNSNRIEYIQWYEPYVIDNYWNCRLEYKIKDEQGNFIQQDKIFKIKNGSIKDVIDKS